VLTRFDRQDEESDAGRKTTAMLMLDPARHRRLDKVDDTRFQPLRFSI
jgi:hypothetical protein